jgi:hypothetical protein
MKTIDGYTADEWVDNDTLYLIVGDEKILSNYERQDRSLVPSYPEWAGDIDDAKIIQD